MIVVRNCLDMVAVDLDTVVEVFEQAVTVVYLGEPVADASSCEVVVPVAAAVAAVELHLDWLGAFAEDAAVPQADFVSETWIEQNTIKNFGINK